MRWIRRVAAAAPVMVVLAAAGTAQAQPYPSAQGGISNPAMNPSGIPRYSPWLNLNRPGGSVTQNYFGLVRPEMEFRSAVRGLQSQVTSNQQAIGGIQAGDAGLPVTGHHVGFMNYGGYFGSMGGGAGRSGTAAGFGAAGRMGGGMAGGAGAAGMTGRSGLGASAAGGMGTSGIRR